MTDHDKLEFVRRLFRLLDKWQDYDLWYRTGNGFADPATFLINCNDVFCWGCADAEEVTPANIHVLEQAYEDAEAAAKYGHCWGQMLFCCRVREMRPQGACYPSEDMRGLWDLFDACGPEREVGMGNPRPHPAVQNQRGKYKSATARLDAWLAVDEYRTYELRPYMLLLSDLDRRLAVYRSESESYDYAIPGLDHSFVADRPDSGAMLGKGLDEWEKTARENPPHSSN